MYIYIYIYVIYIYIYIYRYIYTRDHAARAFLDKRGHIREHRGLVRSIEV